MSSTVSVVIPSTGRGTLAEAIRSARDQTVPPSEIIVSFDGGDRDAQALAERLPPSVQVVATGAPSNANRARNVGISHASGRYVALLDDDDVWLPTKLETQVQALADDKPLIVCACPVLVWDGTADRAVMPARPPLPRERLDDYLLVRHRVRGAPYFLQTSTWLAARSTFTGLPFPETLTLHQDLDWLLRAAASGLDLRFVPDPLVRYRVAAGGQSMSKRSRFQDSRRWVLDPTLPVSPRARADFLLGTTAVFAARERRPGAYAALLLEAVRVGRPSMRAIAAYLARLPSLAGR